MKKISKSTNSARKVNPTVEVLYQRIGSRWYAFSAVGNDVYFAPLTQKEISELPEESFEEHLNRELAKEKSAA